MVVYQTGWHFFELVASGNFDINHIAFQLFLDVVKLKIAGNIHAMLNRS